MLRLIISIMFLLHISAHAYAEEQYTFAGITLFKEPQLPICPDIDLEPIYSSKEDFKAEMIETVFSSYLDSLDASCILSFAQMYPSELRTEDNYVYQAAKRDFRVFILPHHDLTSGIPIKTATIKTDDEQGVYKIELAFNSKQSEDILHYLEGQYKDLEYSTSFIDDARTGGLLKIHYWRHQKYSIFFIPEDREVRTLFNLKAMEQEYLIFEPFPMMVITGYY